eukprot:UN10639
MFSAQFCYLTFSLILFHKMYILPSNTHIQIKFPSTSSKHFSLYVRARNFCGLDNHFKKVFTIQELSETFC